MTRNERPTETQVMCSSTRRLSQLPRTPLLVAGENVHPASSVRDLGAFIDDLGAATVRVVYGFGRPAGWIGLGRI